LFGGAWVAQLSSVCLQLRSWSQSPGIEPCIGLPAQQGVCLSLSLSLSLTHVAPADTLGTAGRAPRRMWALHLEHH